MAMDVRRIVRVTAALLVVSGVGSTGWAEEPAAVFKAHCAKCHGETGEADTPTGKMLKVPKLAGNAKVAGMAVADIVKLVKENEKHKAPLKKLSEAQIEAGASGAKTVAEGK
jgi:mono/diheme cytochrome c family protein